MKMTIIVESIYPPVPSNAFDFAAHEDGKETLVGHGATAIEAIEDLFQLQENVAQEPPTPRNEREELAFEQERAQLEYERNSWPGDGSGIDDLADYNANEADDYRHEGYGDSLE